MLRVITWFLQAAKTALSDRLNQDVRRGCALAMCLTSLLTVGFITKQVIRGENYSPFVIKISGIDATFAHLLEVGYESPFGSKGQLQYENETGLFRTANFSQPIARLSLRCSKDADVERIGATLWFVKHELVEQGLPLNRGGRTARFVSDTLESPHNTLLELDMDFEPLSRTFLSPYSKAMNWRGDLALVLNSFARGGLIALGIVLCGFSVISMIRVPGRRPQRSLVAGENVRSQSLRAFFVWGSLISTIVGVLYCRDPEVFLWPAMEVEDGASIFGHYYVSRSVCEIFRFKAGYIPLIPNLLGYISARIPCQIVPYYMSLIPLGFCVIVYSFGIRECCARFFPGRLSAWLTCVLACLSPYSSFHMHASVDYMIWNLLALLLMICIADPGCTRRGAVQLTCLMCMLVWSHPLAVTILPVLLVKWWLQRTLPCHLVFASGMACLYYCFGVEHGHGIAGISLLDRAGEYLAIASSSVEICIRGGFRAFLGPAAYGQIFPGENAGLVTSMAVLFVFGGILFSWRRGMVLHSELLVSVTALWCVTFFSSVGRGLDVVSDFDHQLRYIYVQSVLWVYGLVSFVFWVIKFLVGTLSLPERVASRLATMGVGMALLVWFCVANQQIGYLFPGQVCSGVYGYADRGNGRIMQKFMRDLAILEDDPRLGGKFLIEAAKVNDWKVIIDTRVAQKESGE